MSELPVITYTDSEGQVFNFMSDLDDVRDYQRVLVPRTTPEEPLSKDADIVEPTYIRRTEEETIITGTTFSYKSISDVWSESSKTIYGDIVYGDNSRFGFSLPYIKNAIAIVPGITYSAIDESVENIRLDTRVGFTRVSEELIREDIDELDDSFTISQIFQVSYQLNDDYFYDRYYLYFQGAIGITNESYPSGYIANLYISSDRMDSILDLEGYTYTYSLGENHAAFINTDTATLDINEVTLSDNVATIDFSVRYKFDLSEREQVYSVSAWPATYLYAYITDVHDDGIHSIIHQHYEVKRYDYLDFTTEQNIRGYKDYYNMDVALMFGDEYIHISGVIGGTSTTDFGDVKILNIEKKEQGPSSNPTIRIDITIEAPSGYAPVSSILNYSYPEQEATVRVLNIIEYESAMNSDIHIISPCIDNTRIENIALHIAYDYPDDTIYGSLFYCGRIISGSFHEFEWTKSSSEMRIGETVNGWTKSSKEYKATLLFSGTDEQKRLALNRFHTSIENDIMNETPGTLQWDDATIECYIRGSTTKPSDTFDGYTENEITIYCPRPFWEHQLTQAFYSGMTDSEVDTTNVKDWPHDYSGYDYMFVNDRESYIINDGPMSEWQIIINGPAKKPKIQIGNNIIAMNTEIPVNSYLMIDSRDKIIYLVNPDGSMDNRFGERNLENYIFNKIEPGVNKVTWNGSYEWLLTLYEERSEPRWPY